MTVPMNLDVVTHEEGDDDNDDDFADDGYVVASKSSLSLYMGGCQNYGPFLSP